MAYHNKKFSEDNFVQTGFGIGPHDYVAYTYGTGGGSSATNLTDVRYYRGGQQTSGTLIAHISYTYDSNDNVLSAERVA
jgi:hypothetical protein